MILYSLKCTRTVMLSGSLIVTQRHSAKVGGFLPYLGKVIEETWQTASIPDGASRAAGARRGSW